MRSAYRCRAYPDPEQVAVLNRTFGCVRLVWNKTLAERHRAYHVERKTTSYRETDSALTEWRRTEGLAFLSEVSSVPLQQTLRHQHAAFGNFFAGRARHPRFKSGNGRQSAHYTRSAFRMRDGQLFLAKTITRLRFVWSWPEVELTALTQRWWSSRGSRTAAGTSPSRLTTKTHSQPNRPCARSACSRREGLRGHQ